MFKMFKTLWYLDIFCLVKLQLHHYYQLVVIILFKCKKDILYCIGFITNPEILKYAWKDLYATCCEGFLWISGVWIKGFIYFICFCNISHISLHALHFEEFRCQKRWVHLVTQFLFKPLCLTYKVYINIPVKFSVIFKENWK
jgi:hypothetical protein